VVFDVLTTCQPSTVWCSRERLPAAAAQPAKVRQSCSTTEFLLKFYSLFHTRGGDSRYRIRTWSMYWQFPSVVAAGIEDVNRTYNCEHYEFWLCTPYSIPKCTDSLWCSELSSVHHPWWWRQYASLKCRSTIILHGSTSQKTILNIILAAVRTWNLTY
jgi:hypothetical protein